MMLRMIDGELQGVHRASGQNPAVGSANADAACARRCASLDWLVVRDLDEIETAPFWHDSPEHETGEVRAAGHRHRGVLPARRRAHREGRQLHQHPAAAAVAPQGRRAAGRLPLGAVVRSTTSAAGVREQAGRLDGPEGPADPRPDLGLPAAGPARRARRRGGAAGDQRPQGRRLVRGELPGARGRRLDHVRLVDPRRASTPTASTRPARKKPAHRAELDRAASGAGRGRRTAASSTTARRPTPTASRGRSASATSGGTPSRASGRASATTRTSRPTRRPTTAPGEGAKGMDAIRGDDAVHRCTPTGSAGSTRRRGLVDGPLPDALRAARVAGRATRSTPQRRTRRASASTGPRTPTTRRRRAGRRGLPVRADHLPADRAPHRRRHVAHACPTCPSCSPRCSARSARSWRRSAGSSTAAGRRSSTARAAIEARVLVTDRDQAAARRRPRPSTRSACRTTGARKGLVTGDAANELLPLALDRNVHITEYKVADLRHPARAAGRAARRWRALVEEYRRRAGVQHVKLPRRRAGTGVARVATASEAKPAHGLLHRHQRLHRLQGVRGRLQGVEPGPDVAAGLHRRVLRQHDRPRRRHLAPRRVRRAAQAGGPRADGGSLVQAPRSAARSTAGSDLPGRRRHALADGLRRLQALHPRRLPGGLPDRRAVPHRVRHRRRPGGRLQRLRLLRARPARSA